MLEDRQLREMGKALTVVFALPISRLTLREIQNVLVAVTKGEKEKYTEIFESLVRGEIKPEVQKILSSETSQKLFKSLIDKYSLLIRVAIDVHEKGEFLNLITSDLVSQNEEQAFFLNRVRRVDGQEFQYISDTTNVVNLIDHYIGRLEEIQRNSPKLLKEFKGEIGNLKDKLGKLV